MDEECQPAIESQVLNKVLRKYEMKVGVWPGFCRIDHRVKSAKIADIHIPPVGHEGMWTAAYVNLLYSVGELGGEAFSHWQLD